MTNKKQNPHVTAIVTMFNKAVAEMSTCSVNQVEATKSNISKQSIGVMTAAFKESQLPTIESLKETLAPGNQTADDVFDLFAQSHAFVTGVATVVSTTQEVVGKATNSEGVAFAVVGNAGAYTEEAMKTLQETVSNDNKTKEQQKETLRGIIAQAKKMQEETEAELRGMEKEETSFTPENKMFGPGKESLVAVQEWCDVLLAQSIAA